MKEKEFVSLVERLEVYARKHPTAYRLRVALLAGMGYFALAGTLVVVLLLVGACIYFAAEVANFAVLKFLILPVGVGAILLRSMRVEFPKPQGHRLRPSDAPRLFELIKRIQVATKGPEVHHVLLSSEFNAAIIQRPRLGIFGWHENYLKIGLPLLHALSPDEVRAVIAHEFGHLSRKHGVSSGWIYRVRQTWIQVLGNMERHRDYGTDIFHKLFNWYAPYFYAYSFVLNRATELEADRFAVVLAGKQNAARALIKIELKGRAIDDEFWPGFFRGAESERDAPQDVFTALLKWVREPLTAEEAQRSFSQSLTHKHNYSDSHPALGDRLEAIGYRDVRMTSDLDLFAKNTSQYGDEYFLRKPPTDLIASWNLDWREDLGERWEEVQKFFAESKKALAVLDAKAKNRELTIDERLERANLIARIQRKPAVIPLLQEIVAIEPDHVIANFALGDALLEQGDEAGIKHLEAAMEKDVHCVPSACDSIFLFLAGRRRTVEAEKYRVRARLYQEKVERAHEERSTIKEADRFKAHALTPDALVALRAQLATFSDLKSAHLVQKVVKHFPEDQSYVLGIIRKRRWNQSHHDEWDRDLVNRLAQQVSFPGFTYIIALEGEYKPFRKIFKEIQGAEIYRAAR